MHRAGKKEDTGGRQAVSIIIPVYNAANHLRNCLASVRAQSLKNLEIICVDDASQDGSADILQDFAKVEPRARVIRHASNQGEGASRNTGLRAAGGDYIFHLDADDSIPANALALLYRCARQHDSEMVRGSFEKLFPNGERHLQQWPVPAEPVINTCIQQSTLLQQIPPSHCAYLYQREFLERNNLRYSEDLTVGLDLVALAQALLSARRVSILPDIVYHYHQSPSSATRGDLPLRLPLDAIAAREQAVRLLLTSGFESAALERLRRWSFDIRRYWLAMPEKLSFSQGQQVFAAFRKLVHDHKAIPWSESSAHHHRYLLALVLSGRDREAFNYLATTEAVAGFDDPARLRNCLSFVLEVAPGDAGARRRLQQLTNTEANCR